MQIMLVLELEVLALITPHTCSLSSVDPAVRKLDEKCLLPFGHAQLNKSHNLEWYAAVGAGSECELKLFYTVEHLAQDGVHGLF